MEVAPLVSILLKMPLIFFIKFNLSSTQVDHIAELLRSLNRNHILEFSKFALDTMNRVLLLQLSQPGAFPFDLLQCILSEYVPLLSS